MFDLSTAVSEAKGHTMTEYDAEYLRRLRDAVEAFEAAFDAWMTTQIESTHTEARGLMPTVWSKEGQNEGTVRDLELAVAQTAGLAARAVAITGAYIVVQGLGAVDPISNWSIMSTPKTPIAPRDVRMTASNVKGRLDSMITDALARGDSSLPSFSPAQLHRVVWAAAAAHWTTHQYRVAVREASEGLTVHWKERLARHDVDDTTFWQQTLSPGTPTTDRPKLVWPGDPEDKTTKSGSTDFRWGWPRRGLLR